MCAIFEFSDFAQKWWKKIRFKFEIRKILVQKHKQGEAILSKKKLHRIFNLNVFYKGFPCKFYKGFPYKKNYKGFPYKMNPEKFKGNSFIKERKNERKREGKEEINESIEKES